MSKNIVSIALFNGLHAWTFGSQVSRKRLAFGSQVSVETTAHGTQVSFLGMQFGTWVSENRCRFGTQVSWKRPDARVLAPSAVRCRENATQS